MNPDQMLQTLNAFQRGVAVGGCGPGMNFGPNAYAQAGGPGGPGCDPMPAPIGNLVPACAIDITCNTPLGFRCGVDVAGNVYPSSDIGKPANTTGLLITSFFQLFPRNSTFWINGFRTFNDPGQVIITFMQTGDDDTNRFMGETDAATYNTDNCFCPVNFGCVSSMSPLRLGIRAVPLNPSSPADPIVAFAGTAWGIRSSSMNSCGPQLGCG